MRLSLVEIALLVAAAAVGATAIPRCSGTGAHAVRASWQRTPGALNPEVTQRTIRSTICRSGWTKTVRPPVEYTNTLKQQQLREYGLRGSLRDYQEDHLISLELGGDPRDPRNLWPEPYPRASKVDAIENQLNHAVCAGKISLAEGQRRESALKHRDG